VAVRIFDNRLSQEWKGFVLLRRVTIAVAVVHFSLAAASGYRAIVQVYDVTIESPAVIHPGSPLIVHASTSGRTRVEVRVDLVQGGRAETLSTTTVLSNDAFFYDPRAKGVAIDVAVPADILSRFYAGKATIRAVATGRSQFLRTPPPTVDVLETRLEPPK
jgi:hypothetical protein